MNAEQFQQFMQQMQANNNAAVHNADRSKRLTPFNSGDAVDWLAWRKVYENTRLLKGWNDQQSKLQLIAAMEGTACRFVSDIAVHDDAITWQQVLQRYHERFVPPQAGKSARLDFRRLKQKT